MTERELKVRYKNTILGFLWVTVNPLMQMIVIGFVFQFFITEPIQNYYFYLISGLLVWNFFSLTLTRVIPSIVNERLLIKKAFFPRQIIPLSIVLSNLVNLLVSFCILILIALVVGTLNISYLPSLAIGLSMLVAFTIGLGLLGSSLNVRYRDINFIIQAFLVVWFYATPIIYSTNLIPQNFVWLWRINPMASIMQFFQNAIAATPGPAPDVLAANLFISLIVFYFGIKTFAKESKYFDDWL